MFHKIHKHLYQQILQIDTRACQLRDMNNKILYTNAKGTLLFGLGKDPFPFHYTFSGKRAPDHIFQMPEH